MIARHQNFLTPPRISVRPDDPVFYNDPYPVYDEMRECGPAFFWEEYDLVCLARHEPVSAALRDRRFGREATHVMTRKEAGLAHIPARLRAFYEFEANSMLEREPPAHTRLRGLVNRAFISRHIERLRPQISKLSHQLIDGIEARGHADLLPVFAEKIPVVVIAGLLGVPADMADQLLDWSHRMVAMYQFNRTRDTEDAAVRATLEFSRYIRGHVKTRRGRPGNDLISLLMKAEQEGDRLSSEELVTTCILLLNAGHEATVHGIGNAIWALLRYNAFDREIFADTQRASMAVDELLRFDAPLHLFTRFVLEDVDWSGLELKRGQRIGLLLGAANRDPRKFPSSAKLDFRRGGGGHLAFGAGIHFCVGAPLARLEMATALPILFERLPSLRISATPSYGNRYHFHGLERLEVDW